MPPVPPMAAPCGFTDAAMESFADVDPNAAAGGNCGGGGAPQQAPGAAAGAGGGGGAPPPPAAASFATATMAGAFAAVAPPVAGVPPVGPVGPTLQPAPAGWMLSEGCLVGPEADAARAYALQHCSLWTWASPLARQRLLRAMQRPTLTAYQGGRAGVIEQHSLSGDIVHIKTLLAAHLGGNFPATIRSSRCLHYLGTNLLLKLVEDMSTRMEELRQGNMEDSDDYRSLLVATTCFAERGIIESVFRAFGHWPWPYSTHPILPNTPSTSTFINTARARAYNHPPILAPRPPSPQHLQSTAPHMDIEVADNEEVVKALVTAMSLGSSTTFSVYRSLVEGSLPLFKFIVRDGTLFFARDVILGMKAMPEAHGGGRLYHGVGALSSADAWRVSVTRRGRLHP